MSEKRKDGNSSVELGIRCRCDKCGTKYYDLGKEQPLCPFCGTVQHICKGKGKRPSVWAKKLKIEITAYEEFDVAPKDDIEFEVQKVNIASDFGIDEDVVRDNVNVLNEKEDIQQDTVVLLNEEGEE